MSTLMKLHNPGAEIFVPDGGPLDAALKRITHLGIGAHPDDLEFMAFHGILECFYRTDKWFGGVTCTNGAGSSRSGPYAGCSDAEMVRIRRVEQNKAAVVGQYAAMWQLDYSSREIKEPHNKAPVDDLARILAATTPEVVYMHNPADKHDAHIGVVVKTIRAIRELPAAARPKKVVGCEVWRNLDWMIDSEKVVQDVTGHDSLAAAMFGVFDSQIAGGKRYDRATIGRRCTNASYLESHVSDRSEQLMFAIDLTPLAQDDSLDIIEYTTGFIRRFEDDVRSRLEKMTPV